MTYRKIGGLRWIGIGRLRIAFCIKRRQVKSSLLTSRSACATLAIQSEVER